MPKQTEGRPTVSIIGPGRVGRAFAKALSGTGYKVDSLVFHESKSARAGCRSFPKSLLLGLGELDRLPASDVLLITTPDDAIAETAKKLATAMKPGAKGRRVALHTSGALSSNILAPLNNVGFVTGSIHPLVAIDKNGADALRGAYYCVEGSRRAVAIAKRMAADLGGESFVVDTNLKTLYHAAAVIASPHLVALFDLALELMMQSGVKKTQAHNILLRLVESTVKNLQEQSPAAALTGTFQRGDAGTVEQHLKALKTLPARNLPDGAIEVYKTLGLRSLRLAEASGLDRKSGNKIKKLLERS